MEGGGAAGWRVALARGAWLRLRCLPALRRWRSHARLSDDDDDDDYASETFLQVALALLRPERRAFAWWVAAADGRVLRTWAAREGLHRGVRRALAAWRERLPAMARRRRAEEAGLRLRLVGSLHRWVHPELYAAVRLWREAPRRQRAAPAARDEAARRHLWRRLHWLWPRWRAAVARRGHEARRARWATIRWHRALLGRGWLRWLTFVYESSSAADGAAAADDHASELPLRRAYNTWLRHACARLGRAQRARLVSVLLRGEVRPGVTTSDRSGICDQR